MEASREVARSRRLRKLLELVLALGNYMNRGARGNAFGFRLQSLNRLTDTKASSAKAKGTTLLHYLVQVVEAKFKDILRLEEGKWKSQSCTGCLALNKIHLGPF